MKHIIISILVTIFITLIIPLVIIQACPPRHNAQSTLPHETVGESADTAG